MVGAANTADVSVDYLVHCNTNRSRRGDASGTGQHELVSMLTSGASTATRNKDVWQNTISSHSLGVGWFLEGFKLKSGSHLTNDTFCPTSKWGLLSPDVKLKVRSLPVIVHQPVHSVTWLMIQCMLELVPVTTDPKTHAAVDLQMYSDRKVGVSFSRSLNDYFKWDKII